MSITTQNPLIGIKPYRQCLDGTWEYARFPVKDVYSDNWLIDVRKIGKEGEYKNDQDVRQWQPWYPEIKVISCFDGLFVNEIKRLMTEKIGHFNHLRLLIQQNQRVPCYTIVLMPREKQIGINIPPEFVLNNQEKQELLKLL